jgi:hypothetical protein
MQPHGYRILVYDKIFIIRKKKVVWTDGFNNTYGMTHVGRLMFNSNQLPLLVRDWKRNNLLSSFPVPVCGITASGVPGGTLNRFSTLCG